MGTLNDSQNYDNLPISLRESLESDVMINSAQPISIVCYFPRKDRWCKLGEMPSKYSGTVNFIFGRGELHSYKK